MVRYIYTTPTGSKCLLGRGRKTSTPHSGRGEGAGALGELPLVGAAPEPDVPRSFARNVERTTCTEKSILDLSERISWHPYTFKVFGCAWTELLGII